LDEATSALDPTAERIVQQALNNVAADRTMVVIAHRLSTIRDADNIVVMNKGTIVEQGTHNELIELGGVYSRLVLSQDLGQEGNKDDAHLEHRSDEQMTVTKTLTANDGHKSDPERAEMPGINYNLMKCLAIIIGEQRSLWFPCAIVGLAATIGGSYILSLT
jgi:ATP-binding cassette subfamily B (MDR/TAP) protein 1